MSNPSFNNGLRAVHNACNLCVRRARCEAGSGLAQMTFYLYAAVIGAAISIAWIGWLFAARAALRRYQLKPGYLLSVIQVALVLALMLLGFKLSDYCLEILNRTTPSDVIRFRRIWIAIWALAMVASIQVFLDIRRMAASEPAANQAPRGSAAPAKRTRPRRVR